MYKVRPFSRSEVNKYVYVYVCIYVHFIEYFPPLFVGQFESNGWLWLSYNTLPSH